MVNQGAICHRSGAAPVASDSKLDLCGVEVCACFGMVHYGAGKLPEGFLADTNSSTNCPYRRLCHAALGNQFRACDGNLLGHLGYQIGKLLGCLGTRLHGSYLVTDNPIVRPANPSMGLRPANTTSPAYLHTSLSDRASIAGSVLG
jgi:hypothetical protein